MHGAKCKKCQCFDIFTIYRFMIITYDAVLAVHWTITEIHGSGNQNRNCKRWIWKAKCFHGGSVLLWTNSPSTEIKLVQYMVGLLLSEARMFTLWPTLALLELNVEWMEINSTPSDVGSCNGTAHQYWQIHIHVIVLWSVSPYRQ